MNKLQIFNYESKEIRTVTRDNEPWWVLKDVCDVLGLSDTSKVSDRLDSDELTRTKFGSGGQSREMYIINESGLYNVIFRSDKPEAKKFKKWVTSEVLPTIRKTGSYSVSDYQAKNQSIKEKNADIRAKQIKMRTAENLIKIAQQYDGTYRQVLHSYATKEMTGEYLLPLPKAEKKTYSATEIGGILGISANKVGQLTNKHNLKTEEYGAIFHDKSRYSNKEVETFRYYDTVIDQLKAFIG